MKLSPLDQNEIKRPVTQVTNMWCQDIHYSYSESRVLEHVHHLKGALLSLHKQYKLHKLNNQTCVLPQKV